MAPLSIVPELLVQAVILSVFVVVVEHFILELLFVNQIWGASAENADLMLRVAFRLVLDVDGVFEQGV